ncbi:hypothetical protein TBS_11230 [Thermobispora bispora]|jgi:hypothetical protein|uniref:Uncharacterized protein n=1 Tax=Thermobispora bispora (strain ATCC 19993 / DSM 43833 / CBS 139.67 / JCM 10125 / KCTC 9307 / NBRC 14880 / R51) TaxID=469371 RepID=D6Y2H1_THEBD|nr:hypothetical protein [Thermobispora bispora]ADG88820.1 hypothetical protein Tbis_2109 [Thermobispora bispora DSM 43833]MBO2473405.1 hypothetical protein [Actinomycetales bacterium]MBX6167210.1 hypothetical protein [Thermobispora bispora]QSI48585.1 hypothetical protein CYL17_12540 [Thermobispora bispora]
MPGDTLHGVPLLSRGRHRNPAKGACFMELASYLAGERWSDHPSCTHPLLAGLARMVNDLISDEARPGLAVLIPSVIGLVGDDPRLDARIALRCATTALPVAAHERQLALAVSILAAERVLARLEDRPYGTLEERSREALLRAPDAWRWARDFRLGSKVSPKRFRKYAAPSTVQLAVVSVAEACIPDPDALLKEMLAGAIDDCWALLRATSGRGPATVDPQRWAEATRLTRRPAAASAR